MKKKNQDLPKELQQRSIEPLTIQDAQDGRKRLRVQFDITWKGHPIDPVGESETEPDMTLSIGQLLEQHSRGKEIPMKEPIFFDMEIPTFNDLTDVEQYKTQLEERIKSVTDFLQSEQQPSRKTNLSSSADVDGPPGGKEPKSTKGVPKDVGQQNDE